LSTANNDDVPARQAAYDLGKRDGRLGLGGYYAGAHTNDYLNGLRNGAAELAGRPAPERECMTCGGRGRFCPSHPDRCEAGCEDCDCGAGRT